MRETFQNLSAGQTMQIVLGGGGDRAGEGGGGKGRGGESVEGEGNASKRLSALKEG